MPSVSFIYAPGCLAAAGGLVTPLQTSTVHLKMGKLLISGVNQVYHQINWDNLRYPRLVTCGPERVGTGATPTG